MSPPLPALTQDIIHSIARAPRPQIVSDFDGTLSHRVDDPAHAAPVPGTLDALHRLLPLCCDVTILSSRALQDLRRVLGPCPGVRLLGSSGQESDLHPLELTILERELRAAAQEHAASILHQIPHAWIEPKPLGFAVHLRALLQHTALAHHQATLDAARAAITKALSTEPSLHLRHETDTIEASVRPTRKAAALAAMLESSNQPCLFAGDDHNDLEAMHALRPHDLACLVGNLQLPQGPPPRAQLLRLSSPNHVVTLLNTLADLRETSVASPTTGVSSPGPP